MTDPTRRIDALPVYAGFPVPYVTPRRPDGAHLFGARDPDKLEKCITSRLCQTCGGALMSPMVFLLPRTVVHLQQSGLVNARTKEPAFHPHCATYAIPDCPTLAGNMGHYRTSPPPLGDGIEHAPDTEARLGHEAESWYAVTASGYAVEIDQERRLPFAVVNELGELPAPLIQKDASQ